MTKDPLGVRLVGGAPTAEAFIRGVWQAELVAALNRPLWLDAVRRMEMSTEAGRRRVAARERDKANYLRCKVAAEESVMRRHHEVFAATTNATLRQLLTEHQPKRGPDGLECHACPPTRSTGWEGEEDTVHQDSPCPTWNTIAGDAP